jgi:hypothetical protein
MFVLFVFLVAGRNKIADFVGQKFSNSVIP